MSSTEAFNIIFKNYPEEVQLSEKRAKKYIKKGKGILNKSQKERLDGGRYIWKERGTGSAKGEYLFDTTPPLTLHGDFVVKNPKAAGTPKIATINGQIFWRAGPGNEWLRQAIKDSLRTWFVPAISRHLPTQIYAPRDHYIQLEYIFFYSFINAINTYQDYLNHGYVYAKVFEDILTEMEIIKDDNPGILRGGYLRYVNIPATDERRLEVKIHFCKNTDRIS